MFVDEEEGDIDDESDVELDGNDQLDLDSEHNDDDLESDLLSDSGGAVAQSVERSLVRFLLWPPDPYWLGRCQYK